MVTNRPASRDGGRPRTFADGDIFLATAHALARRGGERLTLAVVAREVGCTPQALVRRFGSKHGLLRAFLEWTLWMVEERFRACWAAHDSPLGALRAYFVQPAEDRPDELVDSAGYGNYLAFFVGARHDPEFRALLARRLAIYQTEIARELEAARGVGEIIDCVPAELAHLVIAATAGASLLWAANPDGSVVDKIARAFDAAIKPYRVPVDA